MTAKPAPELASGGVSRTPIGRADLVRALVRCGGQAGAASLERFASLAGFVRRPVVLLPRVPIAESQPAPPLPLPAETAPAEVAVAPSAVSWYAVVQMIETPPAPDGQPDNGPVCLRGVPPLTADDLLPEASAPLLPDSPLLPWARLWPFLKQTLGATTAGPIDVPRVAGLLAEGRVLRHLPRLCRSRWAPEAQVLVDFDLRLEPFRQDFNDLCAGLLRLRGPLGLQILRLLEEPGGAVRPWGQATAPDRPWRPPAPGAPVLLCSDLGMLAGRDSGLHAAWLRFGRLLNARGIRPWVLAPVSPERLSPAVLRHFEVVCFTPDAPLRPCHAPGAPREAAALAELLAFLAPAVRVEPALLRAAVRHLAPRAARAGVEAAFWNHPDFVQAHGGVAALPDAAHRTRAGFARLTPELQRDAMGLLHRAHAHLPPAVLHEERLTAAGLANPSALAAQGAQVDRSARFLLSAAASFHGETAQLADAKAAWARRLLDRGDAAQRSRHPAYSVLYAAAYRQALLDGAPAVPDDGLDRQEILRALADPTASPTRWDLVQDSHTLRLVPDWTPLDRAHLRVSLLARLRVTSPLVAVQTPGPHGGLTMQPLGMDPVHLTRLAPEGLPIKVSTGSVEIVVDAFPRPPWARAIGRDAEGLWCDAEWLGQRVRLRWGALEHAPHWGWQPKGGVGVDTFGLYADFTVAGVTQRCRWIAPGSFRMGSPPDEV
ncbi:MAG TPA: hypothetical protein PLD90_13780, partial [Rhodocyclaceae bacterium]|nr:hypothetical protein [Rhodocyclaceae bacterium]